MCLSSTIVIMGQVKFSLLPQPNSWLLIITSTDLGKVLAGIQVPESEHPVFDQFLQKLGYPFVEETHNPMFKRYFCE